MTKNTLPLAVSLGVKAHHAPFSYFVKSLLLDKPFDMDQRELQLFYEYATSGSSIVDAAVYQQFDHTSFENYDDIRCRMQNTRMSRYGGTLTPMVRRNLFDPRARWAPLMAILGFVPVYFQGMQCEIDNKSLMVSDYHSNSESAEASPRYYVEYKDLSHTHHSVDLQNLLHHFPETLILAMPRDDAGRLYALNPMWEMSSEEIEALLLGPEAVLEATLQQAFSEAICRAASNTVLPMAHADYQDPELCSYSLMRYFDNVVHSCTHCGRQVHLLDIMATEHSTLKLHIASRKEATKPCPLRVKEPSPISVPSGKLFYGTALNLDINTPNQERVSLYQSLSPESFDLNYPAGQQAIAKKAANGGWVHGAGVTKPCDVYRSFDNEAVFILGRHAMTKHKDQLTSLQLVGRLNGSLWAYSMIDSDTVSALNATVQQDAGAPPAFQVQPGTYLHWFKPDMAQCLQDQRNSSIKGILQAILDRGIPCYGILVRQDHHV